MLLRPTMVGILRCGKMLPPQLNLVIEIEFADATTALWSENAGAHPAGATPSTDFEIQNVQVLASQVVLDSALVGSFNRALLSGRSLVFSYAVQRPERRGGAQRHQGARLHETHGRVCDLLGQRKIHLLANPGQDVAHRRGEAGGQPPAFADAAGQPAVPSQPHEGSLRALPLPLRPRGHLRRHGAQHRHWPRGLPAPQLHCRLSHRARAQDAAEWCQHLVAYQLATLSARAFPCLTKARRRSSPFLMFSGTAFEVEQKRQKKGPVSAARRCLPSCHASQRLPGLHGSALASSACWSTAASASCTEFRTCSMSRPPRALHERPGLQQPGGRVLYDPHQGVKVRNDLKGAEHQRVGSPLRSRPCACCG